MHAPGGAEWLRRDRKRCHNSPGRPLITGWSQVRILEGPFRFALSGAELAEVGEPPPFGSSSSGTK